MTGDEEWARAEALTDDPLTEPWQARAVALAVETVDGLGLDWDAFRQRLIDAVADEPERPYYESWLTALEALVLADASVAAVELDDHRLHAAAYRTDEAGHDDLEVFPIAVSEPLLSEVLTELFEVWWPHITFGTLIDGAVYELQAAHRPALSMLDGYLTVAFEWGHLHLCIGAHEGVPGRPVTAEMATRRRCAHAELQRQWVDGAPRTWMFRMFNGDGDQQLTVLLPNPFLDDDHQRLPTPDWDRLALWDQLRHRYLGLPPDPADRLGDRFVHA
jgi:hypothetical protein